MEKSKEYYEGFLRGMIEAHVIVRENNMSVLDILKKLSQKEHELNFHILKMEELSAFK